MVQLTLAAFVELLARHQLLEAERLEEAQHCAARFSEAHELAQELMRRGWLTAFQVNQIFLERAAELVVGQFVLLDRLGEGGMGQVFKAWQRNLRRIVALKLIRKECLDNARIILRFQREIRAAGQLAHPHIVHAYDAGHDQCGHFIAMEYIEGLDLARMVQQSGPLAAPQACDFLRQAALGLQHAYEHGLVHRDIKPANLLWTSGKGPASGLLRRPIIPGSGLNPRPGSGLHARPGSGLLTRPGTFPWGIVKILDLGLARWIGPEDGADASHVTQLGAFMGTPDFMAPEQALNAHTCDIRSDVYSLGCTFYYLLTGEVPFPGGSITEKIVRHQKEEPEPVEAVRQRNLTTASRLDGGSPLDRSQVDTPVSVACLVRRLMAKSPAERVQTPGELAELLEEIQNNPGQASMPPASAVRAKPAPRPLAGEATVMEASTPRSAVESCVTIATFDGPLVTSLPEILIHHTPPSRKRRWAPAVMVCLAIVIGALAAVMGGQGSRPQAGTTIAPVAQESPETARSPHARRVTGLIAQVPSPLDRLEWQEGWPGQLGPRPPELIGMLGQSADGIQTLAFSPDGHFLVAAGGQQVRYWNMARLGLSGGETPIQFAAHSDQIQHVAFAPEGRQFATACLDGTCKIWDTKEPGCVLALAPQQPGVTAIAFSPTGTALATAGRDGIIRLWDRESGKPLRAIPGNAGTVLSLAFSADGRFIFWGGENTQVRWADAATGKSAEDQVFTKAAAWVNVLAFHPNGQDLVLGGGGDGALHLCRWDGKQFTHRRTLKHHRGFVRDLAFAHDGARFVTVSDDKTIKLWDGQNGTLVKAWDMPFQLHSVAFAPDGRHFAAGSALSGQSPAAVFIFRFPSP